MESQGWFQDLRNGVLPYLSNSAVKFLPPVETVAVPGDGNCFFAALHVSLEHQVQANPVSNLGARFRAYVESTNGEGLDGAPGARMRRHFCAEFKAACAETASCEQAAAAQKALENIYAGWELADHLHLDSTLCAALRAAPSHLEQLLETILPRIDGWKRHSFRCLQVHRGAAAIVRADTPRGSHAAGRVGGLLKVQRVHSQGLSCIALAQTPHSQSARWLGMQLRVTTHCGTHHEAGHALRRHPAMPVTHASSGVAHTLPSVPAECDSRHARTGACGANGTAGS